MFFPSTCKGFPYVCSLIHSRNHGLKPILIGMARYLERQGFDKIPLLTFSLCMQGIVVKKLPMCSLVIIREKSREKRWGVVRDMGAKKIARLVERVASYKGLCCERRAG